MTAMNYDGDGAQAAVAETPGDRLMGWSVVGVGLALAVLPLLGVTGGDSMFTTAEVVPPLFAVAAIVAAGLWLRRSAFTPGDVATVAVWVATTALGIGLVSGLAAFDPTSHDAGDANTLSSLFDVVLELRETADGSREIRALGHSGSPQTWQPF